MSAITEYLYRVRATVAEHKQKPLSETTCVHCGYHNGGAFSRCPNCKRDVNQLAHPGGIA